MLRSLLRLPTRTFHDIRRLRHFTSGTLSSFSSTTTTNNNNSSSSSSTAPTAEPEQLDPEDPPTIFDLPLHTTIPVPPNSSHNVGASLTWHKQPGDLVRRSDVICESETGDVSVESHVDGYLAWSSNTSENGQIEGERAPLAVLVGHQDDVAAFEYFAPTVENKSLVYDGLFGSLIRKVKIISVSSCGLTMVSMPMLAFFGDESVPVAARAAIAGVVMFFGAGTTATVHWMCHPYITQMWRNTQDHYTSESLNMFGVRKYTNFIASDVVTADARPFATFKLAPYKKNFYVHTDDECWRPDEHRDFFFTRQDD